MFPIVSCLQSKTVPTLNMLGMSIWIIHVRIFLIYVLTSKSTAFILQFNRKSEPYLLHLPKMLGVFGLSNSLAVLFKLY